MTSAPRFSVVLPLRRPRLFAALASIDSVRAQSSTDWELVVVEDANDDPILDRALRRLVADGARIRLVTSVAAGTAVAALARGIAEARGDFVAVVAQGDLITTDALERMATAIDLQPDVDFLYSDEERLDFGPGLERRYWGAFRKPDWSPERFRAQFYTGSLAVLRRETVEVVGGLDPRFDGVHEAELALRVVERGTPVVHVPRILYRRVGPTEALGADSPDTWDLRVEAVAAHLNRTGSSGSARRGPAQGLVRVVRPLPQDVTVSVIIPTNGSSGLVRGRKRVYLLDAVRSLVAKAGHRRLEIVVVWDRGTDPRTLAQLRRIAGERLLLVEYARPFNFSEKCNLGVLASHGDIVVMLNDDVDIRSDDFIVTLCAPLLEPGIGMTGAMQYYEDGTIQHAGQYFGDGAWGHMHVGEPPESTGDHEDLLVDREVSGVTASCAAMRRELFTELGGYDVRLPGNFQDVDFAYKVRRAGQRIVWLADAKLMHYESKTRTPTLHDWEVAAIHDRWGAPIGRDPYRASELDRETADGMDDQVRRPASILRLSAELPAQPTR
jgi:GT2 family glycosyltransferase